MAAVTVLRRARRRVANPARFTQGQLARSAKGRGVLSKDSRAVRWCAIGACEKSAQTLRDRLGAVDALNDAAAELTGIGSVVSVNDGKFSASRRDAHALLLRTFDRAIELAEARS